MKNINLMISFVLMFSFIALPVIADTQCLTDVTTSTSSSRATTGTGVTITVTTTGSSCTINTLALVSTPSLSVSDPADGQYSGFSAGSPKTFTVTAGTTGTYTYYSRGTTSVGSVDSTSDIIEFVSPSDMTVSTSPSSVSVTSASMFNVTVNVQNSQTSDITTSYSLSLPSGFSRNSGDPLTSSNTVVSASSTKALTFEVKNTSCSTGGTMVFGLGDTSSAASVTISGVSSCGSSSTGSSGSGSGGGGGASNSTNTTTTSSNPKDVHIFSSVTAGITAINKITNTEIAINEISIEPTKNASSVKVSVTKLASQPTTITKSPVTSNGKVYQYIDITIDNLAANGIGSGKIKFTVPKSWLSSNGFTSKNVSITRYSDGNWQKLSTNISSEDSTNVIFEARTPGFSTFAIIAEKGTEAPAAITPSTPTQTPTSTPAQTTDTSNETSQLVTPAASFPTEVIYIIVAIIVVAVIGYLHYHNPRTKFKHYYHQSKKTESK